MESVKQILGMLSLLVTGCQAAADDAWLRQVIVNVDNDGVEWLRTHLKEELNTKNPANVINTSTLPQGKCQTVFSPSLANPRLVVCLSFSVPDPVWLALAKDVEALGGIIALRGLPNNSFPELAKRLLDLKEKGFSAQVELNPLIFQEYQITKVPTFILPGDGVFDKLSGNITVRAALEQFEKQGETQMARELLESLNIKRSSI